MVLSFPVSLLDDGCNSAIKAKREKKRPPGTTEFIVSESAVRIHLMKHTELFAGRL